MPEQYKLVDRYQLVYADPPWQFNDRLNMGKRGASHKYQVMALPDLCALGVNRIADDHCLLAMWWVAAMPEEALLLVRAWGFRLVTMTGFTWHKMTIGTSDSTFFKAGKSHFGLGRYTRGNAENCLFAVRGRPKVVDRAVPQMIHEPVGAHSAKPDEARSRLIRLLGPDVRRCELFARRQAPGFDVWGNEVQSRPRLRTLLSKVV